MSHTSDSFYSIPVLNQQVTLSQFAFFHLISFVVSIVVSASHCTSLKAYDSEKYCFYCLASRATYESKFLSKIGE